MLKLVKYETESKEMIQFKECSSEAHEHHQYLIDEYLKSHRIRNHSIRTISKNEKFLNSWFKDHGTNLRPLLVWEAMEPGIGRQRIANYGQYLINVDITNKTIRNYIGMLQGFFSFVLAHPYIIQNNKPIRISELYGRIEQPVSEYEIPTHAYDSENRGIPIDPERIYDFIKVIRDQYLNSGSYAHLNARNYAIIVLATETGLRADEIINLDLDRDLFFESKKIQTREGKSKRGSGKRSRVTLFSPLARDTIKYYLKHHRPHIKGASDTSRLFISRGGKRLSSSQINRFLKIMIKVSNKNNVFIADHFSPHWFRRIFATRFIERYPEELGTLVTLLGHSGLQTVHTYIKHSEAWKKNKMQEVLERVEFNDNTMEL